MPLTPHTHTLPLVKLESLSKLATGVFVTFRGDTQEMAGVEDAGLSVHVFLSLAKLVSHQGLVTGPTVLRLGPLSPRSRPGLLHI